MADVLLVRGDARRLPLADGTIQCVVTSPPYWVLRKYAGKQELVWGRREDCEHEWLDETVVGQPVRFSDKSGLWRDGRSEESRMHSMTQAALKIGGQPSQYVRGSCIHCGAWRGAYGLEPTVEMYVQHTVEILREIRRVLRKDGVCFWNIGDSYAGGGNYRGLNFENTLTTKQRSNRGATGICQELGALGKDTGTAKPKDLCLIPQRVALAAQADGWWLRSDIVWAKPNPMPESVCDRPTDAYEHILMFTKSARYYWDAEAVREPHQDVNRPGLGLGGSKMNHQRYQAWADRPDGVKSWGMKGERKYNPLGRNLRNVWTFPTQPYKDAHFATFPEELPRRCIKAATKPGDLVLDPFAGSGTTGLVSCQLGRRSVLIDLGYSENGYTEIAKDRLSIKQRCMFLEVNEEAIHNRY